MDFDQVQRKLLRSKDRKAIDELFGSQPYLWALEHFDAEVAFIKQQPGIKLRVNVQDVQELRDLLPPLVTLADLVVFSPALAWYCCSNIPAIWPGFASDLNGWSMDTTRTVWFTRGFPDYFSWLASCRPFFESGMVTYLPRCNYRWRNSGLAIPKIQETTSNHPEEVIRSILTDLYIEHIVSHQLGCVHLDSAVAKSPLWAPRFPRAPRLAQGEKAYLLLKLRVPFVKNVSTLDLHRILVDEGESVSNFRRSIRQAMSELEKNQLDGDLLDAHVANVQRDLIDDPFYHLQTRLRRIEKIRRKKFLPYAISSVAATALVATGHGQLAAAALAGVSFVKLMETYYNDVEKDLGLHSNALYWLNQLSCKSGPKQQ